MKLEPPSIREGMEAAARIWPGLLLCGLIALSARFLSEHYGAPVMLMALLIGLSVNFIAEDGQRAAVGVGFTARKVLRIGVALLGARISFEGFAELGLEVVALAALALLATVAAGYVGARALGRGWRLAVLTSGAVAICGASAAMAISAVLPRGETAERDLSFTVMSVTLLGTLAMVFYPILAQALGLSELATSVFLGGSVHDVAQAVGAGFSVSEAVGENATTVKLVRVSLLAPFVLALTLILRRSGASGAGGQAPVPFFVLGFFALATVNSLGLIPDWLREILWSVSSLALVSAIAAMGARTDLRRFVEVPLQSVALILGETLFLAGFVLVGAMLLFP